MFEVPVDMQPGLALGRGLPSLVLDRGGPVGACDLGEAKRLLVSLAKGAGALELRLARLGCHGQVMDLRKLGFSSFSAFVRERMGRSPSWQRAQARLLRSDLDLIKRAVAAGAVPICRALQAPGRVRVDQQEEWLRESGTQVESAVQRVCLEGKDALSVRQGRERARLLVGRPLPDGSCDALIMEWHREGETAETLLNRYREPLPPPDLTIPTWNDDQPGELATALVGPWRAPVDVADLLRQIERVQVASDQRQVALGRLLDQTHASWPFLDWGDDSFAVFVEQQLGISLRHAQRLRRMARDMDRLPGLLTQPALPLRGAQAVAALARTAQELGEWLGIAPRLPMRELLQAPDRAALGQPRLLARRYKALLGRAPSCVKEAMAEHAARPPLEATWTGAPRLGSEDPSRIQVALAPMPPDALGQRGRVWALPGLLAACRWLLDTVAIPIQTGTGRIKLKHRFTCQNPECGRRWIGVHVHHLLPRSVGGSDDPDNLLTLCPGCHLRLVHGGYMDVVRLPGVLVFLLPGRAIVAEEVHG